jgi:hypothetical protein
MSSMIAFRAVRALAVAGGVVLAASSLGACSGMPGPSMPVQYDPPQNSSYAQSAPLPPDNPPVASEDDQPYDPPPVAAPPAENIPAVKPAPSLGHDLETAGAGAVVGMTAPKIIKRLGAGGLMGGAAAGTAAAASGTGAEAGAVAGGAEAGAAVGAAEGAEVGAGAAEALGAGEAAEAGLAAGASELIVPALVLGGAAILIYEALHGQPATAQQKEAAQQ